MNTCHFYIAEKTLPEDLLKTAAGIAAQIHRQHFRQEGRMLVLCPDPEAFVREMWRVPGFIPSAAAGSPDAQAAPVVAAGNWCPGFGIILSLRPSLEHYAREELDCALLADFTLKSSPDLLPASRSRYRQLLTMGIRPENISIS